MENESLIIICVIIIILIELILGINDDWEVERNADMCPQCMYSIGIDPIVPGITMSCPKCGTELIGKNIVNKYFWLECRWFKYKRLWK